MKSYVINLARAPDRLAHIEKTFGAAGIAFERFEAIDGESGTQHADAALVPPMRVRPWSRGEIACLLSHYSVWQLIAEGPDRYGAIFEDDVHIDPRLKRVLDSPDALPPEADVIKLETVLTRTAVARHRYRGPAGVAFAELKTTHYGAGAYILTRELARRLVQSIRAIDVPADDLLFSFYHPLSTTLKPFQLLPALAIQDSVRVLAGEAGTGLASILETDRTVIQSEHAVANRRGFLQRARRGVQIIGERLKYETLVVPFGGDTRSSR